MSNSEMGPLSFPLLLIARIADMDSRTKSIESGYHVSKKVSSGFSEDGSELESINLTLYGFEDIF